MESKVQASHLGRNAVVYVRQSTFVQVEKNQESTRRQYDLVGRAQELGWSEEQVVVIDEDQGRSGATSEGRSGFARVMSEVALGQVGIVLAIEASRLARNNADWQRLIWFCSLTETLLADQDGLYDPSLLDDRMVLGLKGTISELEWHTIRKRLRDAAMNKARRGELEIILPAGYEWQIGGGIVLSPDRQVTDVLRLVFDKFDELGSSRQVALWLREQDIKLPRRQMNQPKGPLRWIEATKDAVYDVLTHPIYAGAYVYGRRRTLRQIDADGNVRKRSVGLRRDEWSVLIRDHHPGLIDWQRYEQIEKRMMENRTYHGQPGPVREGAALLQGLVYCGSCGRRMAVAYNGNGRRFGQFICRRDWENRGSRYFCQTLGGRRIETAVVELFLDAVEPAGVEVALHALESIQHEQEQLAHHWRQRIERAEYEAELARGRYEAVDVANRLVSVELERRWNEALASALRVRREAEEHLRRVLHELSDFERQRILRMSQDVHRIWTAPTTTPRDRKRLLRSVLERVVLTAEEHTVKVSVEWKGGQVSKLEVERKRRGEPTYVTDKEVVELVRKLAVEGGLDDTQIARVLIKRNMRTATGLTFTKLRVQSVRSQYQIPRATGHRGDEPSLTAEQAAAELGVSDHTIHAWLRDGLLRGEQLMPGAPWRIVLDDDTRRRLAGENAPTGWVGFEQAARRLGVSKQTVSNWVKSGKLQAVRVARGRRKGWRICVESTGSEKQLSFGLTKL
jgi:excisionase family DNA binding protein